jgi:hypothetical protein
MTDQTPPLFWIATGFLVTVFFGSIVSYVLKYATQKIPLDPPQTANDTQKDQWKILVEGNEGGAVIGYIERTIFFAAILLNQPLIIGTWLAFKVASKWQVWGDIISVPNKIEGIDDLDLLKAKRQWGSHLFVTFLVGTGWNIIAAMLGVAVSHSLESLAN